MESPEIIIICIKNKEKLRITKENQEKRYKMGKNLKKLEEAGRNGKTR